LSLAAFEMPCYFRTTGTAALDKAGIAWRHAFGSPNLSVLWAAVSAGLGITIRTHVGLPAGLRALAPGEGGLPVLPSLGLTLQQADHAPSAPAARLADIVLEAVCSATAHLPGAFIAPRRAMALVEPERTA
jgi:DNA-binding transcriptional LysR family regulator